MRPSHHIHDRWLAALVGLAIVLRLGYVLHQDFNAYYTSGGGDTQWYLSNGYTLVTGDDPSGQLDVSRLPTAPLYLIVIGTWQAVLEPTAAIMAILLTHVLLSTCLVIFEYDLAHHLTGDRRVARLGAGVMAVSPALILETGQILTETFYLTLVMAGLWVVITQMSMAESDSPATQTDASLRPAVLAGIILGLATLTRAVLLLYPPVLALALGMMRPRTRANSRQAVVLAVVYCAVVLSWSVYNLARWNRVVLVAEGFSSFIYVGSRGWTGPQELDQSLAEDLGSTPNDDPEHVEELKQSSGFLRAARRVILADPLGYFSHRVSELGSAYLQPHATVIIGGPSLKSSLHQWATTDRSLEGLLPIMRDKTFWPKLLVYIFHFAGLGLGLAGVWRYQQVVRITMPLAGLIVYTTLVHLVMLALPRYLFPLYPIFWLYAAATLVALWDRLHQSVGVSSARS